MIACRLNYICGLRITLHTFSRDTSNMSARITSGSRLEFKTDSWRTCRLLCNDGDAFFFSSWQLWKCACSDESPSLYSYFFRNRCNVLSIFFLKKKKMERGPKIGYISVSLACSTACELFLRGRLWDSYFFHVYGTSSSKSCCFY